MGHPGTLRHPCLVDWGSKSRGSDPVAPTLDSLFSSRPGEKPPAMAEATQGDLSDE